MTFTIVDGGALRADAKLNADDFRSIAAHLKQRPTRARKIGYVAARQTQSRKKVETRWNGQETTNTALPGDWIVTSLSPSREILHDSQGSVNTYVIQAERFEALYEPAGGHNEAGAIYRAKGIVDAILLPGGFDILAPWGERQTAPTGYLILNGNEVYGNNADTFAATYEDYDR
jgi:hypothetical protein